MPDISELNGTAIANVAEFDALTVTEAGVAPLLDTYTNAAAAYSVRLLRTAYTGDIMRVRRDSDNVEVDVGFDSNDEFGLTSPVSNASSGGPFTDFADFIGHGGTPANGFVRYWYDQSGNANDVGQSTAGSQPQIYNGTAVIETNSKPALSVDDDQMTASFTLGSQVTHYGVYSTSGGDIANRYAYYCDGYSNFDRNCLQTGVDVSDPTSGLRVFNGATNNFLEASQAGDVQQILGYVNNGTSSALFQNDNTTTGTLNTNSMGGVTIANAGNLTGYGIEGTVQEAIFWETDFNATDRTGIKTNLDSYYSIPNF